MVLCGILCTTAEMQIDFPWGMQLFDSKISQNGLCVECKCFTAGDFKIVYVCMEYGCSSNIFCVEYKCILVRFAKSPQMILWNAIVQIFLPGCSIPLRGMQMFRNYAFAECLGLYAIQMFRGQESWDLT